jgi:hypothetical protein
MSEELANKIDELIFWTKYSVWKTLLTDLKVNLKDDVEKLVYELSDGRNSSRDIAQIINNSGRKITHVTVTNLWQKWSLVPLVIPTDKPGRYKKAVSLRAVGIDIPAVYDEGIKKGDEVTGAPS